MSFRSGIDAFQRQIRNDITDRVEFLALYVFRGVINKSPVDTGRFRASWTIAEGSPDISIQGVGMGFESPPVPFGLRLPDFPTVFVNNSVPYGESLEMGRSGQAPAGMVGVTLAEVEAFNL